MISIFDQIKLIFNQYPSLLYLTLALVALGVAIKLKFLLGIVAKRLRKLADSTSVVWDDVAVDAMESLKTFVIFVWVFFLFSQSAHPSESFQRVILFVVVLASVYQFGLWGLNFIKSWRKNVLDKRIQNDPSSAAALGLLYTVIQALFLAIIAMIGLSNLGIDITALIAGLGVGGIAVALAAQNVLGDLLASLSIVLDKPFVIGDFIVAGTEMGTVEHIGIKSTRLRSLSGEQLVLSNKDLLESRIRNHKRMWQRRVVQNFGVVYSTSAETLEKIPGWVKSIIEKHPKLLFDRCHFLRYGDSSLDFEFVFFVAAPEYNIYMDLQQKVLLDLLRKFSEEKVDFAFPSQSLYIEKVPNQ